MALTDSSSRWPGRLAGSEGIPALGLVILLSSCLVLEGCHEKDTLEIEPPLRPLLYTERPADEVVMVPAGYEMWNGTIDPTAYPDEPPVLQPRAVADHLPAGQVDLSTPEALARAVFRALTGSEEELLLRAILSAEHYAASARTSVSGAEEHMAEVERESRQLMTFFAGEIPSEQRAGGLGSMLQIESVVVPAGRRVTGETAGADEPAMMVWGTEVRMRLYDSSLVFSLRFPKILRAPDGHWGLAEAPEIDGMLQLFTQMGFHLSPVLMSFEHYPYPLETGNYWSYRIRQVPRHNALSPGAVLPVGSGEGTGAGGLEPAQPDPVVEPGQPDPGAVSPSDTRSPEEAAQGTENAVVPEQSGAGTSDRVTPSLDEDQPVAPGEIQAEDGTGSAAPAQETPMFPGFTDEVIARTDYDGYSLVSVRRGYTDGVTNPRTYHYVLTARRVYRCDRDCRRNIEDISWLLSHLSRRVPELVFPLQLGVGWRTGGRIDERGEYRTRSRHEVADVPVGRFEDTFCISRSITEGQEYRYFEPGIGVVLTRIDGTTFITYEELVGYRITP